MLSNYDVEISIRRSLPGAYRGDRSVLFRMAFHEVLYEYRKDKSMFLACVAFLMVSSFVSSAFGMGISCLAHTWVNGEAPYLG